MHMPEVAKETVYSVLREIKRVAMEGSLTGTLQGGTQLLAASYNRCLEILVGGGDALVSELFQPLSPQSTSVDEVGVAAALLLGYLRPHLEGHGSQSKEDWFHEEEETWCEEEEQLCADEERRCAEEERRCEGRREKGK